jgi:hypothetical protein
MTRLVLLTVSAAEQYNATTQQMLQKQQDGSSKRKGQQHKQQPPFPDCESENQLHLAALRHCTAALSPPASSGPMVAELGGVRPPSLR